MKTVGITSLTKEVINYIKTHQEGQTTNDLIRKAIENTMQGQNIPFFLQHNTTKTATTLMLKQGTIDLLDEVIQKTYGINSKNDAIVFLFKDWFQKFLENKKRG